MNTLSPKDACEKLQRQIMENKVKKGFNTSDVPLEFCLIYGELEEAFRAWRKDRESLPEEVADVAIYLLGLSEMNGFNLWEEIEKKIEKNKQRVYVNVNGVHTKVQQD